MDGLNELIRCAQGGDQDAWRQLHDLFRPELLKQAQRLLGRSWPHESASDLTQTTWGRAARGLARFRGAAADHQTEAVFRAWLRQIMKRVWLNKKEREHPTPPGTFSLDGSPDDARSAAEVPGADPTPSRHALRAEQVRAVEQAIEGLDDVTARAVVRLHKIEGLSLRATALRLGITWDRAHSLCKAARGQLERALQEFR